MPTSHVANPNDSLKAIGYSPISDDGQRVLINVLGSTWLDWLSDCVVNRESSEHWEALRSALMAISEPVNRLLQQSQITALPERRVEVFVREGRQLRAAVATLCRASSPEAMQVARQLLRTSFKIAGAELQATIAAKVHKVFGARAAIAFEVAKTKSDQCCLQVEAAGRLDSRSAIAWDKKIVLQLNDSEILQLIAVLSNHLQLVEFKGHGKTHDKRMTCEKQIGGWKLSVRQGGIAHVLPLPAFEAFKIISLGMRVLLANSPHLSPELIASMANEFAQLTASC